MQGAGGRDLGRSHGTTRRRLCSYDTAPQDSDTTTVGVQPESWVTYPGSGAATTFAARAGDGALTEELW